MLYLGGGGGGGDVCESLIGQKDEVQCEIPYLNVFPLWPAEGV